MRIFDISQEVLSSCVFPGDPAPKREVISDIDRGDICNLTAFSMCAHNGTHIDAPYHFLENGDTVERIALPSVVGYAYVTFFEGEIGEKDAERILLAARSHSSEAAKRLLIGGKATLTYPAARLLAREGVLLFGNESQTVGPSDAPMAVHKELLSHGTVLLEGIRLSGVAEGAYLLCAAPLCLGGADGAPVRAVLIEL